MIARSYCDVPLRAVSKVHALASPPAAQTWLGLVG